MDYSHSYNNMSAQQLDQEPECYEVRVQNGWGGGVVQCFETEKEAEDYKTEMESLAQDKHAIKVTITPIYDD